MPQPYNSYLIVSSSWVAEDSAVAQILVLSGDTPPARTQFVVMRGGPDAAYDQAFASLKTLPANEKLEIHVGQ
jgi:hypothetical protein